MSETRKKYVGLKQLRTGRKRPSAEDLVVMSRKYEKERNSIARESYQKMQKEADSLGVEAFNAKLHSFYAFR